MTIKDFNLLKIDVSDGENIVYSGMCSDAPDELKQKQVEISGIDGKKLLLKLKK